MKIVLIISILLTYLIYIFLLRPWALSFVPCMDIYILVVVFLLLWGVTVYLSEVKNNER